MVSANWHPCSADQATFHEDPPVIKKLVDDAAENFWRKDGLRHGQHYNSGQSHGHVSFRHLVNIIIILHSQVFAVYS